MKARKRPIIVEAVQWFKHGDHPKVEKYPNEEEFPEYAKYGRLKTLEDTTDSYHHIIPTNWIMGPGAAGEFWAIQDEIFKKTYEIVENA